MHFAAVTKPARCLTWVPRSTEIPTVAAISCLVVGIDNHVGAYLARLLDARGVGAGGGLGGVGGSLVTARLGIAEAVVAVAPTDTPRVAAQSRLVFVISDGSAERADLVAETLGAIGAAARPARLLHIAEMADLAIPVVRDTIRRIAATKRVERATLLLAAHDSRLGRRDTGMERIISAAAADPHATRQKLTIAETGPRDWGWTAEYVDAVQRMAARDSMFDTVVASGHLLTTAEIAEFAFGYFRRTIAADYLSITGAGTTIPPIDTTPLLAATGWRATTFGRDLVRALCEGAGDRN